MSRSLPISASTQGGVYPRPQLVRPDWHDLAGEWAFEHDDHDLGRSEKWFENAEHFGRVITVPFPPESEMSGIADPGFHPVVWYSRLITPDDVAASGRSRARDRVILHFGAVDYRASVWIDGQFIGSHEGGQTPFSFDVTEALLAQKTCVLVVRAEDDPHDVTQPRGKQDWLEDPHVIWYHRTTGIWQPVWLESVPDQHIEALTWTPNVPAGSVAIEVELIRRPAASVTVQVELSVAGEILARQSFLTREPRSQATIQIAGQANGQSYETLLWSPENPQLIDAHVSIIAEDGTILDESFSYFGLRSVGVAGGRFLLNDRPYFVRSVLEQGYWPQSHLAAPSAEALRAEVELIKALGFNAARIHEKVEDPRFLYWADRLGLLIWGEMGSTYEFSSEAVSRVTREWTEVVRRDRSHPSIVTWVPLNESWGVQQIAHDDAQLSFAQSLYHLTRALDPTRPVISNDGWEHAVSDILTIHDYASTAEKLDAHYRDIDAVRALVSGMGPAGRRLQLVPREIDGQSIMVTEFGGVSFALDDVDDSWGYTTATSPEDFRRRVSGLVGSLRDNSILSGFCYTQLTDTMQETNGLTDANRKPKLPIAVIRDIVSGEHTPLTVPTADTAFSLHSATE
ncbi:glycoside hydrolase family 2 protein [Cryobacterium roopkundense]|uniref:Beta-galactosidase/beta-glucuronidase n=1 Tax=Cryobacterium roopkundense TaxID=1001240 RepID=A0A7W9E3P3_9MICO|nr:glycoside hydrolase family 2 [Cryobacterium roopkundense]MBB5640599.1 beta-galactosidase/beta-glucuronidase [Cryobacterium roopkundense]